MLFQTLKECKSVVTKITFDKNNINDDCMATLGECIQECSSIKSINLSENKISDKGIEVLHHYLIGNTTLNEIHLKWNNDITDASFTYFTEIANRSCITIINIWQLSTMIEKQQELNACLKTPIDERCIPINSKTKSAAKISST